MENKNADRDEREGNKAEEKDIENVLKILEDFSASETSRLKIQVSQEEMPGKAKKAYHYGRCDVGSPWASGECYDLPEQE